MNFKTLITVCFVLLATGINAGFDDVWNKPMDKNDEIWNENYNGNGLNKFPGLKVRLA
jgi:hypothetical protein